MATTSEVALARAVLIHGPLSRSALTSRLGLSAASLTRLAKPLLDAGVLVELGDAPDGTVGRPSRPLDIAPASGGFVGVKLTGDRLFAVATDIRAAALADLEEPLTSTEPAAVVDDIVRAVARLDVSDLRGVGVSLGGLVRDGVVVNAAFLGWQGVDLGAVLAERLGVPVTVENDLVALTEAERWFGLGRDIPGFVLLTIGAGVGYGLVVAGDVVRTPDAGAGTGGHIPLDPDGPLCPAGHRGCAQAILTTDAIATQVSAEAGRPVSFEEALADGNGRAVVDAAADALGRFIALAANLTMQSSIVLAGEGIALYDVAADRVQAAIAHDRDPAATPIVVHVDRTGFGAWARGAAAVAIQSALEGLTLR